MLTPRQREVADLVTQRASNKAIARELGITVRTVEKHIQAIARRLPGYGRQREKIIWFLGIREDDTAA